MFHFVSFMKQMGNIKAKWAERIGRSRGGCKAERGDLLEDDRMGRD